MIYQAISFLASHAAIIAAIGGTIAIIGGVLPYIERQIRPLEYVYVGWLVDQDTDDQRIENEIKIKWEHGRTTMLLRVPEPPKEIREIRDKIFVLLAPTPSGSIEMQFTTFLSRQWLKQEITVTIEEIEYDIWPIEMWQDWRDTLLLKVTREP